jgi:ketosteroid isomerase-like protein
LMLRCSDPKRSTELSESDKKVIIGMMNDYQNGWLANDSAKVLGLFADTATLVPSGMKPIQGKKKMTEFWWPNDSSKTTIDRYAIDVLEINGNSDWAYAYENGKLSWSYEKGDFKMSKDQESYEITIFRKTSDRWFIVKRIWTDLKK